MPRQEGSWLRQQQKKREHTPTQQKTRNGALAAQTFTITIKPLELPNISDKTYSLGNTINEILPAAIGGTEEITYTLMPTSTNGLTFTDATRAISGTPEKLSRTRIHLYSRGFRYPSKQHRINKFLHNNYCRCNQSLPCKREWSYIRYCYI